MIPGEIVGLYMIGSGFLPVNDLALSIGWFVVCVLLLLVVRIFGSADRSRGETVQQAPVIVAATAFVIWAFWLGGPFEALGIPNREQIASLAILVWSFVVPIFYKGPAQQQAVAAPTHPNP